MSLVAVAGNSIDSQQFKLYQYPFPPIYLLSSEDMLDEPDLLLEELGEQKEIGKAHLGKKHSICTAARPYFGRRSQVFTG
jgi:hypothetical protein